MAVRADEASEGSVVDRTRDYFSESVAELKKVSHPTREETLKVTAVTLGFVLITSICLCILDLVFAWFMSYL